MASRRTPTDRLIDQALRLAARDGWTATDWASIARAARLTLAQAHAACPTKTAILAAYGARLDQAMLAGDDPSLADEPVHDRLFDAIMRRFDAMMPDRAAIRAIHRDLLRDPPALAASLPAARRGLDVIAAASGFDLSGWRGLIRRAGLAQVLARVHALWLEDDDPGQARVMAELDRRLRRLTGASAHGHAEAGPAPPDDHGDARAPNPGGV